MERSEEDRATGAPLLVSIGGEQRELAVLTYAQQRPFERLAHADAGLDDDASMADVIGHAQDRQVELLVAYDLAGVLGGREGIEEAMTPEGVQHLLERVWAVAFPLSARGPDGAGGRGDGRLASVGEVWEWALANWPGVRIPDLTPEQLDLFWGKGSERLRREADDRAAELETAVYHAMASVWDRAYGKRRLAERRREARVAGRAPAAPVVREDAWRQMARDFPAIVQAERLVQ